MKKSTIQSIRGMTDLHGSTMTHHQHILKQANDLFAQAGYQPFATPIVEKTQLFARAVGEVTDIVEKEMYTFTDRNDDRLSLRPEGTAPCVRALIEQNLMQAGQHYKLFYSGPMFRHERPQKGRYRQFHQFGAECFGMSSAYVDAELITLTALLWQKLGIQDGLRLELNTLGTPSDRQSYTEAFKAFLHEHFDQLDSDSQNRVNKNPLRVLDSKNPETQALLVQAPKMDDYMSQSSLDEFNQITNTLDSCQISWIRNPHLVRGLDYYNGCVFEWVSEHLGAQATICGGGRYDGLVEQLGGKAAPGVGFAMGIERIALLLEQLNPQSTTVPTVYVIASAEAIFEGFALTQTLRQHTHLRVLNAYDGGSFKGQFRKADKEGAHYAIILGEEELKNQQVTIKPLRDNTPQKTILQSQLVQFLKEIAWK